MQRFIGVVLGALVTFTLLLVLDTVGGETTRNYAIAVASGALVSWLWPWVFAVLFTRRRKASRDREIAAEVDRQLAEERARQG